MTSKTKAAPGATGTALDTAFSKSNTTSIGQRMAKASTVRNPFWLPINVESYRADTADLSTLEHGAFLLLRLHYWRTGPLKDSDTVLARITGLSFSEWRHVRPSLERFFDISHNEWVNVEWSNDLEVAYTHIQKASAAGKKAALIRWDKNKNRKPNGYESDANRMPGVSETDANRYANYKIEQSPLAKEKNYDPLDSFEADVAIAEASFLGGDSHGS